VRSDVRAVRGVCSLHAHIRRSPIGGLEGWRAPATLKIMRHFVSVLVSGVLAFGCASSSSVEEEPAVTPCEANPETQLRRGGWDGNGRRLGGWDANGDSLAGITLASSIELRGAAITAKVGDTIAPELVVVGMILDEGEDGLVRYQLEKGGVNVCADGRGGIFVSGTWDATGMHHEDAKGVVSFSCMDGAIAKCASWGYAPWAVGSELHQTCTRLVRADYCGSGISFTKNGTLIDAYDSRGLASPMTDDSTAVFEAGWGPNGAVCVNRPRFDAHAATTHEAVMPSCWASLPSCTSWTDAQAKGSTMGNSSKIATRTFCQ